MDMTCNISEIFEFFMKKIKVRIYSTRVEKIYAENARVGHRV